MIAVVACESIFPSNTPSTIQIAAVVCPNKCQVGVVGIQWNHFSTPLLLKPRFCTCASASMEDSQAAWPPWEGSHWQTSQWEHAPTLEAAIARHDDHHMASAWPGTRHAWESHSPLSADVTPMDGHVDPCRQLDLHDLRSPTVWPPPPPDGIEQDGVVDSTLDTHQHEQIQHLP